MLSSPNLCLNLIILDVSIDSLQIARKAEWQYVPKLKVGKEHTKTITFKVNMSNSDQNPYRNLQQNVSDAFKDLQGISYWNG